MPRQRPAPLPRSAGAVVSLALLVAGCSPGAVQVAQPSPDPDDRAACRSLVEALPERVADRPRRTVEPDDGYAAAWGDPAIVLRCGVPRPEDLDETSSCHVANGVGWYIPDAQVEDPSADVVLTTLDRSAYVEVVVPAKYRPPADAMVDLAEAVKRHLDQTEPCV